MKKEANPRTEREYSSRRTDISDDFDLHLSSITHPDYEQKRLNISVPVWMVDALDKEASRLGVTRQSIIKIWLADRLERRPHYPDRRKAT